MDINSVLRGVNTSANKGLTNPDAASTRKTEERPASDTRVANFADKDEKVTLTSAASLLGQINQKGNTGSEINAERVASLRSAIEEGNYQPNFASIAARLLTLEQQIKG